MPNSMLLYRSMRHSVCLFVFTAQLMQSIVFVGYIYTPDLHTSITQAEDG